MVVVVVDPGLGLQTQVLGLSLDLEGQVLRPGIDYATAALTLSTGLTYFKSIEESSIFLPLSRDDSLALVLGCPQGQNCGP